MNIQEAKTHLSRLVDRAAAGEEIVIAKAGKPMAKLIPYTPPIPARQGGFLTGQIWEADDCWNDDPELLSSMVDAPLFPAPAEAPKAADDPAPYGKKKP